MADTIPTARSGSRGLCPIASAGCRGASPSPRAAVRGALRVRSSRRGALVGARRAHRRRPPRPSRGTTTPCTRSAARRSTVRPIGQHLARRSSAMAPTATARATGWSDRTARVYTFNAPFYGGINGFPLNRRSSGMAATPSGNGYWIVDRRRRSSFAFGDAKCYGSMAGKHLNAPIKALIAGPGGKGYWLSRPTAACSRSGRAKFHGSTGGMRLNQPVVGMARRRRRQRLLARRARRRRVHLRRRASSTARPATCTCTRRSSAWRATSSGKGYWLAASDGGVFTFGDAGFKGSAARPAAREPPRRADHQHALSNNGYRLLAMPRRSRRRARRSRARPAPAVQGRADRLLRLGLLAAGRQRCVRQQHAAGGVGVPEGEPPPAHRRGRRRDAERRSAPRRDRGPARRAGYRYRDRQDAPDRDRRQQRLREVDVQHVDGFRPPVHARRRALQRAHARGHVHGHPPGRTGPTRARSVRCGGRSTSRGRASRCTATPTCRRIPRRTAARGCRTPRWTGCGPTTCCRSAPPSGCICKSRLHRMTPDRSLPQPIAA